VPFIPDHAYTEFLADKSQHLHSIHFAFFPGQTIYNSRQNLQTWRDQPLIDHLRDLPVSVKKYGLMNSRFFSPAAYKDKSSIKTLLASLDQFVEKGGLTGIVYSDSYFLQVLSDSGNDICGQLEAVPSINCMLDSFDKIQATFEVIEQTKFKLPSKMTLDRSLNRKLPELENLSALINNSYPGCKIELLANEGCLFQCPYKLSHDAHIAFANIQSIITDPHTVNKTLGCIKKLSEQPHLLFKSPLIRPEDSKHYEQHASILKICGRTIGPVFLKNVAQAYIHQKYNGSLLHHLLLFF